MNGESQKGRVIGANDVSNYVVCPEAWRLKYFGHGTKSQDETENAGKKLREEWVIEHDLSRQLKRYAKVAYFLLVAVVIVTFVLDQKYSAFRSDKGSNYQNVLRELSEHHSRELPLEVVLPLLILGALIFVWDLFDRRSKTIEQRSGFTEKTEVIALKGSEYLPSKRYFSPQLGLSSKPDALMRDGNFIIPVDRKPLSKQVRDRHVVQLLMHLRLVENIEGRRPPYGVLLLGENVRSVKIKNTEAKQRWLDSLLEEMWSIMDGLPAAPAPDYYKCKNCDVRAYCNYSAFPSPKSQTK